MCGHHCGATVPVGGGIPGTTSREVLRPGRDARRARPRPAARLSVCGARAPSGGFCYGAVVGGDDASAWDRPLVCIHCNGLRRTDITARRELQQGRVSSGNTNAWSRVPPLIVIVYVMAESESKADGGGCVVVPDGLSLSMWETATSVSHASFDVQLSRLAVSLPLGNDRILLGRTTGDIMLGPQPSAVPLVVADLAVAPVSGATGIVSLNQIEHDNEFVRAPHPRPRPVPRLRRVRSPAPLLLR